MQAQRTSRPRAVLTLSSVLLLLGASCASVQGEAPSSSTSKSKPSDSADKAEKKEKLAYDLEDARAALELAKLDAKAAELDVDEKLADAGRELEEAQAALKRFQEVSLPAAIAGGQLGIERSMHSLAQAKQEFAQMEAMYAAEANLDATGEATRDMVLNRHRKRIEFTTRSLELQRAKFQDEVGAELPLKQVGLEIKLKGAERKLRKAEQGLAKGKISRKRSLAKAGRAVSDLERKQAKQSDDELTDETAGAEDKE